MSDVSRERPHALAGFETVVPPGKLADFRSRGRSLLNVAFARNAALVMFCGVALVFLWQFSLYLAADRIYQVDECSNVRAAYLLATGHPSAGLDLFQILLSFALSSASGTVNLLTSSRHIMVIVFWINWLFIALATGERLLSVRWWLALLGAATLAPLWDYGFEIRHDNVLLAGVLIAWAAVRFGPPKRAAYFLVGMVACAMQFTAFKALVFTLPLSLAILVFPPPGARVARWKLVAAWFLGALAMGLVIRWMFGAAGIWGDYMSGARGIATASVGADRVRYWWPTLALARFVEEAPLVTALAFAAVAALGLQARRNWRSVLGWEGILPETLLFLAALGGLIINPTPFLYNLVTLVPFAFLLAFRYGSGLLKSKADRAEFLPVTACAVLFTHLAPFGVATHRHLDWPNTRQECVIQLAETLTDSVKDPVFDAVGMVPTRPLISDRAFLHTMDFKRSSPSANFGKMLADRPAAVIIPNYRTDWLSPRDKAFIRERYVSVADDLWVLGSVLPGGGGVFQVFHPGRYRISTLPSSDLAGTYEEGFKGLLGNQGVQELHGTLDGEPLAPEPCELAVGTHELRCAPDEQPAVVWVGPKLDRLPRIGRGDHTLLFSNGY